MQRVKIDLEIFIAMKNLDIKVTQKPGDGVDHILCALNRADLTARLANHTTVDEA